MKFRVCLIALAGCLILSPNATAQQSMGKAVEAAQAYFAEFEMLFDGETLEG